MQIPSTGARGSSRRAAGTGGLIPVTGEAGFVATNVADCLRRAKLPPANFALWVPAHCGELVTLATSGTSTRGAPWV